MPLDPSIILQAGKIPQNAMEAGQQAFNLNQAQINAPLITAQKQADIAQTQQQTTNAQTTNQVNQQALASAKLSAIGGLMNGVKDQDTYNSHAMAGIQSGLLPPDFLQQNPNYDPTKMAGYMDTIQNQKQQLDLASSQAEIGLKNAQAQFYQQGGKLPANVRTAQFLSDAAAKGDWQTVNNIALAGKLLNKGQVLTPQNFSGFAQQNGINTNSTSSATSPDNVNNPSGGYNVGVMPGAKEAASALAEGTVAGKDTPKYSDQLAKDAQQAVNMHLTIGAMKDALNNFQSGATAPAKATLERYAKAFDIPIDNNSLDNQQVFAKLANDVVAQAAKAEGGASRLAAAYNGLVNANPNAALEPGSLSTLLDKMDAQAGILTDKQQKWNAAKQANPNLTSQDFENNYTANLSKKQEQLGGGLPAYQGAQNPYMAPGKTSKSEYVVNAVANKALPLPTDKTALQNGKLYMTPRGLAIWNGSMFEKY